MMKHIYTCIIFCFLFISAAFHQAAAQNISGVINQYAKVTYINMAKTQARVVNNVFAVNDLVLVIQMKGASINTPNTAAYGDITAYNSAGYYEFTSVQSVNADTVHFSGPLCRDFNPADSVQIIKVPVYTNATVSATLTCQPWGPGGVGGVLVFQVTNTLTLNADIDVSGNGFRGGAIASNIFNCADLNFFGATTANGQKGEGIAHAVVNQGYGKGKLANGGGGAQGGNAGGGGGGNYGPGGLGGYQYTSQGCTPANNQGQGGANITYVSERIFMGGGGGGPQRDNGQTVYPGGNGGGIVIIKAGTIQGNNFAIRANGENVLGLINDEGGAGGGAGGSIYLLCPNYNTPLQLQAKGGNGSSNNNTLFTIDCHGPGGGGGGGTVWFSTPATPAGVATDVTPGNAGTVNNPVSSCYNTTHGAQAGSPGGVLYGLTDGITTTLGLNDTFVCADTFNITVSIGSGYSSVQWSTGSTTASTTITTPGIYTVQATTSLGCIARDTIAVIKDTMTLGPDTLICPSVPFTLSPRPAGIYSSYLWSTTSTAPSILINQAGTYWVEVLTIHNCTLSDTISVTIDSIPRLLDTFLCKRDFSLKLGYPPGYQAYLWSTGATTDSITVTQPGIYFSQLITAAGCNFADTVLVGLDTVSLGNDTLVCGGINYTLNPVPSFLFTSYLWQNGDTTPAFSVTDAGTYHVTVHTIHNCIVSDTILVEVDSLPVVHFITSDTAFCEGKTIMFTADYTKMGNVGIEWDFADGTKITGTDKLYHGFDTSGVYPVKLKAYYRKCPNDSFMKDLTVIPFPAIDLGEDTTICPNGDPIVITDRINAGNPAARWVWNTNETGSSITVRHHGVYSATVTVSGCSSTDSVSIFKDCYIDVPNIFTPNGDGVNDYFFPRQLLSRSVISFKMTVFNRWGQVVYETTSAEGRGWDGKFNDRDQPQGVYVYLVDATFINNKKERYTGNVTLLR